MSSVAAVGCVAIALADASAHPGSSQFATHYANVEAARSRSLETTRNQDEKNLIAADLEFSSAASAESVARAFAKRFLPDGKLISPGGPVRVGPAGVEAALSADKSCWVWSPEEVRVDGDLGVTWGIAAIAFRDDRGEPQSVQTRYVTVWRRMEGEWRIWLDIGNAGPADSKRD